MKLSEGAELATPEPTVPPGDDTSPADEPSDESSGRRRWPYWLAIVVLVLGLAVTAALALGTRAQYTSNEKRLLNLRVKEVGSLLAAALPSVQIPLTAGAALADETNGNRTKFRSYISQFVGSPPLKPFISVSLWDLRSGGPKQIITVGSTQELDASPQSAERFFAAAAHSRVLSVVGLRPPKLTRLGYAFTTPTSRGRYVIYAEALLPKDRRSTLARNSAFSDLNYALYLGPAQRSTDLLVTNLTQLPMTAQYATEPISFGNRKLLVVVSANQSLEGSLPQRLPWIIAIAGTLLSLGAALLTARLIQGRRSAEALAGRLETAVHENQRLYTEQRTIALTLQHALLPSTLPTVPGAQTGARFDPGVEGVEIGGDWYDVIPLERDRLLVVVGDVSGRGLPAASTMASLRFAIHAYAAQSDPPAAILQKLSGLLDVATGGQIATVLCALIDVAGREVTLATAGHLPPLVVSSGGGHYLESEVGVPIGVHGERPYGETTLPLPSPATFLAFTDGLVERRGEHLDVGLERLREAAAAGEDADLDALLDRLLGQVRLEVSEDDTAIVGVRWTA